MKNFPFITVPRAVVLLRIVVSGLLVAHGTMRMIVGTVAVVFISEQIMAIILVHAPNGWFVVG